MLHFNIFSIYDKMVGLDDILDYRFVGLQKFPCIKLIWAIYDTETDYKLIPPL